MSCPSLPFQLVTIASFLKNPGDDDGWEAGERGTTDKMPQHIFPLPTHSLDSSWPNAPILILHVGPIRKFQMIDWGLRYS